MPGPSARDWEDEGTGWYYDRNRDQLLPIDTPKPDVPQPEVQQPNVPGGIPLPESYSKPGDPSMVRVQGVPGGTSYYVKTSEFPGAVPEPPAGQSYSARNLNEALARQYPKTYNSEGRIPTSPPPVETPPSVPMGSVPNRYGVDLPSRYTRPSTNLTVTPPSAPLAPQDNAPVTPEYVQSLPPEVQDAITQWEQRNGTRITQPQIDNMIRRYKELTGQ